jgi:hypothetical protein
MILTTVTLDRCPLEARSASTTSKETRLAMGAATSAKPATKQGLNTLFPDSAALRAADRIVADTAKARSDLNEGCSDSGWLGVRREQVTEAVCR